MRDLMNIREENSQIKIHIPERIDHKDVSEVKHPAKKYGAGKIRYIYTEDLWRYKEFDRSY